MKKTIENLRIILDNVHLFHPAKLVFWGYLLYVLIGWALLCLPITQKSGNVKSLDNLFIATSALSTTGLVTVSISDCYNFLGQLIVLILIQLGGIGYMTFGSFVVLSRSHQLSETRSAVGKTIFSLPESFRIDKFIKSVVKFSLLIEGAGAIVLLLLFVNAGARYPLWSAVFHSVSAFCTAGFSIYNDSFMAFADNFWVVVVIAVLSYLGAIGFIVHVDVWRKLRGKIKQITLTSKIILWATFWLSLGGTVLLYLGDPVLASKPPDQRILTSFFQSMTAMTTVGFNTVDIAGLSRASVLLLIVLMVIGASPSGTGGGIKSTTFSAVLGVMRSALTGKREVRFWGRIVPLERVWLAVASLGFYLSFLIVGTYLMEMIESSTFDQNFFEVASALGTVGLSMGITPTLTNLGKVLIILMMFCGRLGPLTFGIALFSRTGEKTSPGDRDLAV